MSPWYKWGNMEIYEEDGRWYIKTFWGSILNFATESEAKAFAIREFEWEE